MAERLENKPSEGLPQSAQPEETYKTSDPRPHYVELDALRGIAILMTVLTHTAARWFLITERPLYVPLLGIDLLELILFGYLAVPLFFLLSGYLLTWTEEGRRRRRTYSVLNYAKRRALRIVPAFYVAILVVVLAWPTRPSFETIALHLTFLHGFAPTYPRGLDMAWWSLTPEIVFYAMLPFLVLRFRKLFQRATVLVVLLLISLATRFAQAYDIFGIPSTLDNRVDLDRLYFFPTATLYLFLAGMLLRMMVERHTSTGREPGRWQLSLATVLSVIPIALILVFPYLIMGRAEILHSPWANVAEVLMISVFASVLLGSPVLKPILKLRPLMFLGEISYSLFLIHTTIIIPVDLYIFRDVLRAWLPDQGELVVWTAFGVFALVILAISVPIAYLSYRYIESPFMRIKPK